MGLSAPKNRFKISKDPNNTTWSNNTTRFGHKLLTSQGWTPGQSLGARDASHAPHYTSASHSHIRVLLKDDTLGLGAKRGGERAEVFGLAGLESVLGRLNGKGEAEVKEIERKGEERRLKAFASQRWGFMNFVSGGFLVGDRIERGRPVEERAEVVVVKEGKRESRKGRRDGGEEGADAQPSLKRKKRKSDLKAAVIVDSAPESSTAVSDSDSKSKKPRKDKKEKRKSRGKADTSAPSPSAEKTTASLTPPPTELTDKQKRKAEKRARKEERRLRKERRRTEKEKLKSAGEEADSSSSAEETQTGISTPSIPTPNPGLSFVAGGRHAVRQRYIRQKKMASMDPNALREIFMIKSPA